MSEEVHGKKDAHEESHAPKSALGDALALLPVVLAKVLLHVSFAGQYGYFRDEFYYIACSKHLDFGYVDHPPLAMLILAVFRWLLGDSLWAIRLPVALAGAATVFVTGWMARELGGRRYAQSLAAITVVIAPIYLGFSSFFSMNPFDVLCWAFAALVLIRLFRTNNPRLWILFGIVAGLGLEVKISMLFFGFGVATALLLTADRRQLILRWPWMGAALAALIFSPNVLWQIAYGFPTLEFISNATKRKNLPTSPIEFALGQGLYIHPLNIPIWVSGLCFYLFSRHGRPYRVLGLAFVVIYVLFNVQRAKTYYLAPAFPMLLAAGALVIARAIEVRNRAWLKPAVIAVLLLGGAATAPMAMPILPVEKYISYAKVLHLTAPKEERGAVSELPQHFADQFGWKEMVDQIAGVFNSLSPAEQARCAIFAANYGEAGAIDFWGPEQRLPEALSGHNNYYFWGPGVATGEIVITVGYPEERLRQLFSRVELRATTFHTYALPGENGRSICLCREPKGSIKDAWREVKNFI